MKRQLVKEAEGGKGAHFQYLWTARSKGRVGAGMGGQMEGKGKRRQQAWVQHTGGVSPCLCILVKEQNEDVEEEEKRGEEKER